jgi:hypothetical protein
MGKFLVRLGYEFKHCGAHGRYAHRRCKQDDDRSSQGDRPPAEKYDSAGLVSRFAPAYKLFHLPLKPF